MRTLGGYCVSQYDKPKTMVQVDIDYLGDLRCQARHEPSGNILLTDAPRDNMGKGEAFSPTDLVGTALATCMMTTMAIAAKKHGIELAGTRISVTKEMVATPQRRIGTLSVTLTFPPGIAEETRPALENAAMTCPVHRALSSSVEMPVKFIWQ